MDKSTKMFEGINFLFIPFGLTFPKKRMEVMSENVFKKGGKVFSLDIFNWDVSDTLVITGKDITFDV